MRRASLSMVRFRHKVFTRAFLRCFGAVIGTVGWSFDSAASVAASPAGHVVKADTPPAPTQVRPSQTELKADYDRFADMYHVSWALLAAIDRYAELTKSPKERQSAPYYGFAFAPAAWAGIANPDANDVNPWSIRLFGGLGTDGNGDGLALPWDPYDRVPTLALWLTQDAGEGDERAAVWDLFQDPVAMDRIFKFEAIFRQFGLEPAGHCFPVSKRYNYTVKHTFGAGRSYGGRRIHEGVDIFASYGTPVLACAAGYVELIGWNRFGGWRIGIRDTNNVYYYYAHLSSYAKGLKRGDMVRPGQVIGYVGSTGYGPPGTAGKFPPHLHFGMYRDTGRHEWAFSPSSSLAHWERLPQTIYYGSQSGQGKSRT